MKISYYAILRNDSDNLWLSFPDLPGCLTFGENYQHIKLMAKDALDLYLHDMNIKNLPVPTKKEDFNLENNQELLLVTTNFKIINDKVFFDNIEKVF